jgi:hypothetical protein
MIFVSNFVGMGRPWYKIPLFKVPFISYVSRNSEPLISSFDVIALVSPLRFISGLLDSLPRSAEVDVTLELSLSCSLALRFVSCALIAYIFSNMT